MNDCPQHCSHYHQAKYLIEKNILTYIYIYIFHNLKNSQGHDKMRGFIFHDVYVEVSENVNVKCASVKCV